MYIAKFERLLYEAKGHNWSHNRKITAFRFGLNSTIKNRLAQQLELPDKYSKFLRVVQKLSSRSGSSFVPASNQVQTHDPRPSNARQGEPMDLSTLDIGAFDLEPWPKPKHKELTDRRISGMTTPSDVELNAMLFKDGTHFDDPKPARKQMARRIPASPQPPSSRSSSPARQSYKEQGACLRCGSYDHWLADCDAPPPLSKNTRSAGTSGKKVTIAAIDDAMSHYDSDDLAQWYT